MKENANFYLRINFIKHKCVYENYWKSKSIMITFTIDKISNILITLRII